MNQILKYACFKSSPDFERWQNENPDCTIFNIVPLVSSMEFEAKEATTNVGVIVIYKIGEIK